MTEYRRNLEAGWFDPKRKKAAKKAEAAKDEQTTTKTDKDNNQT